MVQLNAFATRQNLLALLNHHLRKAGIQATSAMEAREAVTGVGGIVDHSRATLCLWMPSKEDGEAVLRQLGMDCPHDPYMRVFRSGLVKWNHRNPDYRIRTLVRTSGEILVDKTEDITGEHVDEMTKDEHDQVLDALHAHIVTRANQGRSFTNSGRAPNGILHKDNLEKLKFNGVRIGKRKDIEKLLDTLAFHKKIQFEERGHSTLIKPA